jgi:hypothetical protein
MRPVVTINFQKWPLKKKVWPPLIYRVVNINLALMMSASKTTFS